MVDTIVLAGGSSRRFPSNKLAMIYQGKPLIFHTIKPFYDISERVIVVTGNYPLPDLSQWFQIERLHIVHNANHAEGMFTSVLAGIQDVSSDCFVIPGDMPLVNEATLQIMVDATGEIRVPVYEQRRGHPIFLSKQRVKELQQEPPDSNLKAFRDRYDVHYIDVNDPGVVQDIDTVRDANKYLQERVHGDED